MAFAPVTPSQTGAITTQVDFDASLLNLVVFAADKLATTETATFFAKVNGTYVPAVNMQGTAAGLTATVPTVILPGGFVYGVTKSATATACAVYASGVPYKG